MFYVALSTCHLVAWHPMEKDYLTLKPAATSRSSGTWSDDDYDVLAEGEVVGRIMKANAAPAGMARMWTLAFGYHEDRTPTHDYEATREAAMAAFAKTWRREWVMEKLTTKLSAEDRVILFCVASGIVHGSVSITDHAMQSMAIRGFIAHNRESGAYTLTDSGRAALAAVLQGSGYGLFVPP
jgi:hypothetical protein